MNIFANNSGNISLLNLYMNKPMAYMYNDFKGMVFIAEYNGTVCVGVLIWQLNGQPCFASL